MNLRLTVAALGLSLTAFSQSIVSDFSAPAESLINEEFCCSISVYNEGNPGYQPYVRLLLPPATNVENLLVRLYDETLTNVQVAGILAGGSALDPNISSELPESIVTGPDGYQLVIVNLPVGSMVEGGVELQLMACITLDGAGVEVGVPAELIAQPVYRFGDDPTGANGPLVYDQMTAAVIPTLYTLTKEIDHTHYATGSCWDMVYSLKVNIATGMLVNDLEVTDLLPPTLQYTLNAGVTPGCVVTQAPSTSVPGGTFKVHCNTAYGTPDPADVLVSFKAHMIDELDPMSCDSALYQNNANLTSENGTTILANANSYGYHILTDAGESGADFIPGATKPFQWKYKVSEYVDGIDAAQLTLILADGLTPGGNEMLNGVPIAPATILGPTDGVYELTYNLNAAYGGPFMACDEGSFTMDIITEEQYSDGSAVTSSDALTVETHLSYDLINGINGCDSRSEAVLTVPAAEVTKEIVSNPANGNGYVPGEIVTYRLSMTVPSGDARDIVFQDLFPLPIHDVSDLDLTFGNDIDWSPFDNVGLTPQSISVDTDKNILAIVWGDLDITNPSQASVISVDVSIPITSEPFANALIHSNFARFSYGNSGGAVATYLDLAAIEVGAPALEVKKGVASVNNPNVTLNPIQVPVNANAQHVDAHDVITYQITLMNVGDAPAYDVIVADIPPAAYLSNCQMVSVKNEFGTDMPYSGNLFTSGMLINEIDRAGSVNGDWAIVKYTCQVVNTVQSVDDFTNECEATWAAAPGSVERFNPVYDAAIVYTEEPQIEKTILNVEPGYGADGEVVVGELVTYRVDYEFIEGVTKTVTLKDLLPAGMSVESIDSLVVPYGITFGAGSSSEVWDNAQILNYGADPVDTRREIRIVMGNVTNIAAGNNSVDKISLYYKAVVLNVEESLDGASLSSESRIDYVRGNGGGVVTETTSVNVDLVEPDIELDLIWFSEELNPGEETFVTVKIKHSDASTAEAQDLQFLFDLPLGMQVVPESFSVECDELFEVMPSESFGSVTARWDRLPLGLECEMVFTVQISESYPPCTFLDYCASLTWRSLNDDDEPSLDLVPVNPMGVPRTGDVDDPGGVLNGYEDVECGALEIISENAVTPTLIGPSDACNGSTITLEVQEYEGFGVTYHWSGPGVPNGYNNNFLTIADLNNGDAGLYSVYVEVGDCTTDVSNEITLEVFGNPVVVLDDIDLPCTNGTTDVSISPEINGGFGPFDYFWSGPGYSSSNAVAVIPNAGVDDEGVYTLYIIDDNGCVSNTASAVLAVTNAPVDPQIQVNGATCEGDDLVFTCNSYTGDVVYFWNTPNGVDSTTVPVWEISNATAFADGDYSVYVQVNECTTDLSNAIEVAIIPEPEVPEIIPSSTAICAGSTLVLSTTADADTYSWSGPNGYTSAQPSPPVIQGISAFEAGTYTLSVGNSGCWSANGTVNVEVLALPASPAITSNAPLCAGDELIITTSSDAEEFEWETPGGAFTTTEGELIVDAVVPTDEGAYSLMVFDGFCYSLPSTTLNVQVDVVPSIQAAAGNNVFACDDGEVWLQSSNNAAYTGYWSTTHEELQIVSPETASSAVLGAQEGESYVITWTLFNEGCGVYSSDDVLLIAPQDPVALTDSLTLGEGTNADVFVLTNDWFDGLNVHVSLVEHPQEGIASVGLNEYVNYEAVDGYFGEDELTYEICLDACPQHCDTAVVKIFILPHLEIPDVITPNGDGANDALVITGLENFPNNELYIYNRWGHEVYHASGYQNNWDGEWKDDPLPEGTYYYVFKETDARTAVRQGYIVLHR
ncbi:MAG: gliding motility-associated C-terminal domain-containing protein [Flavobacteriales bacterium]|nr:gliding motility-associated C-terminal domain-containing protein [Flavobacteriales bacterium]